MAPAYAVPRLLARNGLSLQDFDFYEIHEAFAATVLSTLAAWEDEEFCRERLGLDAPLGAIDRTRLNVNGSSLAAGHPFAATGGRIVATLGDAAPREGAGLARPDLDLRRRWAGRRRDPRGGLTMAHRDGYTAFVSSGVGKKLADHPRAAPAGGAAPPGARPPARRRPGARRWPRRHPGPGRAARRPDRAPGPTLVEEVPEAGRLGGVRRRPHRRARGRPTWSRCAPPSARP